MTCDTSTDSLVSLLFESVSKWYLILRVSLFFKLLLKSLFSSKNAIFKGNVENKEP